MYDDYKVVDRMTSCLAMSHHIQMRIANALASGRVSQGVSDEVRSICESISEAFLSSAKLSDD